jgi:hypothetical protein
MRGLVFLSFFWVGPSLTFAFIKGHKVGASKGAKVLPKEANFQVW